MTNLSHSIKPSSRSNTRTTEQSAYLSYRHALTLIIALLIGAAIIFTYDLAHTPPGVASDAMGTVGEAFRIMRGIPYPATFGGEPEPAYRFILAGWMLLTGPYILTTQLFQVLVAILTIALMYRAGLELLRDHPAPRLGALIAAGTMAAIPPYLFIARMPYRTVLVPPLVLLTFILLLKAHRSGRSRTWAWAGFVAGLNMHTYPSGIATPLWVVGLLLHQLIIPVIFPRNGKRIRWLNLLATVGGMLPPVLAWLALVSLVPDLFNAMNGISGGPQPTIQYVLYGFTGAFRAYFLTGHHLPTFNAPHAPFLNPALALLAVPGFLLAIRNWQKPKGALLLGGLFLFTLPGALTYDVTYPFRYVGSMPLLALLVGWGAAWVVSRLPHLLAPSPLRSEGERAPVSRKANKGLKPLVPVVGAIALITLSLVSTHLTYQYTFTDPAHYANPRDVDSVPHNYSMAFEEAMQALAKVDRPTYVPMWMLDNPAAAFFLQREAFPNVTTWARYGLREFPAGQFFFPVYWYYHMTAEDTSTARVLLLPQEKTIILLPGYGLPDAIAGPPPQHGDPNTREITNERGWVLARTRPVPRADFTPPPVPDANLPVVGNGLQLITRYPVNAQPGKPATILLEWKVTALQPTDIFSVAQLINPQMYAMPGGSDQHVLFYLYPSARWQPGDIIPDWHVVNVPADLPPGIYRWGAGAYVPPSRGRLTVAPPDIPNGPQLADLWLWDAVRIPAPTVGTPLPTGITRLNAQLDGRINLEGYQLQCSTHQWTVTLYWRAQRQPVGDYIVFVHAERDDKLIAQRDDKPPIPTWAWQPGERITTTYTLDLPPGAPEPTRLYVGMYSYPSLERLTVAQDGIVRGDKRVLIAAAP